MTETKEQRADRVREWTANQRPCAVCGRMQINVRHEPDPANSPEGPDYYEAIRGQMHPFVAAAEATR